MVKIVNHVKQFNLLIRLFTYALVKCVEKQDFSKERSAHNIFLLDLSDVGR